MTIWTFSSFFNFFFLIFLFLIFSFYFLNVKKFNKKWLKFLINFSWCPKWSRFVLFSLFFFLLFSMMRQFIGYIILLIFEDQFSSLIPWYIFSVCIESKRCDSRWVLRKFLFFVCFIILDNHPLDFFILKLIYSSINSTRTPDIIWISNVNFHPCLKIIESKKII